MSTFDKLKPAKDLNFLKEEEKRLREAEEEQRKPKCVKCGLKGHTFVTCKRPK